MDKRQQLINVFNALADLIDGWNDAAADDDRGRDNHILVLMLWEDSSGRIGTAQRYGEQAGRFIKMNVNTQRVFENAEDAAAYLLEWVEHSEAWEADAS